MTKLKNRISVSTLLMVPLIVATGCHHAQKHHHKASLDPLEYEHSIEMRSEIQAELSRLNGEPILEAAVKSKAEVAIQKTAVTSALAPAAGITGGEPLAQTPAISSATLPLPQSPPASVQNQPVKTAMRAPSSHLVAVPVEPLRRLSTLEFSGVQLSHPNETPLIFDIPVTYNERVRQWIRYFQTDGRTTFKNWLERSSRFLPILQYELQQASLPQDLVYVAMIESGFVSSAASHADAVGMWQFIGPTAERYNLKIDWWIDERRDFHKATQAAIRYMTDLYGQFNSWYLVAASYNMGEGGVRRLIQRHKTNNFWELAEHGALPQETADYVPKIIAAMLISKAPALYGFRDLDYQMPLSFESVKVPGGTDIINLATYLGVSEKYLKDLNPELIKGFIPSTIREHKIRVPKGSTLAVSQFVRAQTKKVTVKTALRSETTTESL